MQDILSNLWCSDNIHQAAYQLREALPGFAEAQRDYDALAEQPCICFKHVLLYTCLKHMSSLWRILWQNFVSALENCAWSVG